MFGSGMHLSPIFLSLFLFYGIGVAFEDQFPVGGVNHDSTVDQTKTPADPGNDAEYGSGTAQGTATPAGFTLVETNCEIFQPINGKRLQLIVTDELRKVAPGYGRLGDILLPISCDSGLSTINGKSRKKRNAVSNRSLLWPRREAIPYLIDTSVASHTSLINSVLAHVESLTCLRFVPRTTEENFIVMFAGGDGECYSAVGMTGGPQPLSIGAGCENFVSILHELVHAIGFYHEQNRSDRDDYLTIHWENIPPGTEHNFAKLSPKENCLLTPFDFESIMLYGSFLGSKDDVSPAMTTKTGGIIPDTYGKSGLSTLDVAKMKRLYRCCRCRN